MGAILQKFFQRFSYGKFVKNGTKTATTAT
jgi:hypothetical protein